MTTTQVVQICIIVGLFYMMYRSQKTQESMDQTIKGMAETIAGFTKMINLMERDQRAHAAKSGVEHREILDNSKSTLSIVTRIDAKK